MARQSKHRIAKRKSAIIVDGETEKWYLHSLARTENLKDFHIKPELISKKDVDKCFNDLQEKLQVYDKVVWLVDLDVLLAQEKVSRKGTETELQKFIRKRKEFIENYGLEQLEILVMSPCLEYWILLHFLNTGKPFTNCREAGKELKKQFPEYEKTEKFFLKNNIYGKLKDKLSVAVERAEKMGKFDEENAAASIAEIYRLFYILGICKPQIHE